MSFTQTSYIEVNGEYKPINATACGIKCLVCKQSFPSDKLEEHLATHVKPSYKKPIAQIKSPTFKLDLNENQAESKEDIWVKSFAPDELPRGEVVRK